MKPALTYQRSLFEAPFLDIKEGARLRDMGIKKAVSHAESEVPDWADKAYQFLLKFIEGHRDSFMCEDLRAQAAVEDFHLPPSARAWGGVIARALAQGVIKKIGIGAVRNVKAHMANAAILIRT